MMPLLGNLPGKNYTLEETFKLAGNKRIKNHGRFAISSTLFQKAIKRREFLESGRVRYSFLAPAESVFSLNCIHALAGVVSPLRTHLKSGEQATRAIIDFFVSTSMMRRISPMNSRERDCAGTSLNSNLF